MSEKVKMNAISERFPNVERSFILDLLNLNLTRNVICTIFGFIERNSKSVMDYSIEEILKISDGLVEYVSNLKSTGQHQSVINVDRYKLFFGAEEGQLIWDSHRKSKSEKCKRWAKENPDICKKGAETRKLNGTFTSEYTCRSKHYWIRIGYSEEDAIELASSKQKRDLSHFIKQYGEIEGPVLWEKRQIKWQNTLKAKSQNEIDKINKKKATFSYNQCIDRGMSKEEAIHYITNTAKCKKIFLSGDELIDGINNWISENPHGKYLSLSHIETLFNGINCFAGWEKPADYIGWLNANKARLDLLLDGSLYQKQGKIKSWTKWTSGGNYLASMNEIIFYDLLIENGFIENEDFTINKRYPGESHKSYDFYMKKLDIYIEIAGLNDEKYVNNLLNKLEKHNSVALFKRSEYEPYIKSLL